MDNLKAIVCAAILTIFAAIIGAAAAIGALCDYMKERDKKNENWFDPRNDRTY